MFGIDSVYLVIVSKLVLQDVPVGPVWLRPRESDGVWGSAQLVHHGNCTGNCGRQAVVEEMFTCLGLS